ncbi:UDP-N-acetylmuramoyl-L-alanyl-D-glutamate--2,6-diaminopimelate ligase [Aidingimonas lacisalsi]|uniref:UDP-N-acetylmuramoyl-L-alanyl-D-glutamate--2, 6-diaminopimelate ligase n=1 Tax=Aidingimonas lacisalsi TaxID=2604086 RepID=UPI0011D29B6B|nr:UDP-N-acetylmuramoyl-L-alanyl-D-glutamate--2,6-diaminopimelate ligase [Aidingimonas lacisalsi]
MSLDSRHLLLCLDTMWPQAGIQRLPIRLPERVRLVMDSRLVADGDVFIAVPGSRADGREHVGSALEAGAVLVLRHDDDSDLAPNDDSASGRVVGLAGLQQWLGELGRHLFAVPDDLALVGVTGTNGKSSVTHYLANLSDRLGHPAGVIGTLGYGPVEALKESGLTTPGPLALQAQLGDMARHGVTRVAMEVSSHALDQQRLSGCHFHTAVFTNLSRDHLDYHGSMAAYAAAKARLFQRHELRTVVVNGDDPLARLMLSGVSRHVRILACGEQEATTLRVVDWQAHEHGQHALVATPQGEYALALSLMGRFNLDNVLLAMAAAWGLGADLDALFQAANELQPVPGRMESLASPGQPSVVIDYAHTPDALANALRALRAHLGQQGRLWCLFGCGGDRDRGKRALMAKVAEQHADRWVVSDDNPRTEDPAGIRADIMAGLSDEAQHQAWCIGDRRRAIEHTILAAEARDVVLIAGKGHEAYQEIHGVRHAFSDVDIAMSVLKQRGKG